MLVVTKNITYQPNLSNLRYPQNYFLNKIHRVKKKRKRFWKNLNALIHSTGNGNMIEFQPSDNQMKLYSFNEILFIYKHA